MRTELVPLKYVAALNPETLDESTDPTCEFRYIDIGSTGRGRLTGEPVQMSFGESPSRARRVVRSGDTILSTVRTYLRAVWTHRDDDRDLVASTGFVCLRPRDGIDPRYLGWLAESDIVIEEVVARSVGVSYPAINPSDIGVIKVPLPPLDEQRAIADYLDRETARIDAIIAAKMEMIALAQERFWSWLESAIQVVSPRALPLRRLLLRITDGPFGSSLTSADYADGGARVVRLGNIGRGVFRGADEAYVSLDYYQQLTRHSVRPGDLLIAGLGDANNPVGRACVAPDLGFAIVKADCYCASADPAVALAEFIALWLSSTGGAAGVAMAGRGTTRTRINLDIAKAIGVPVPPLSMQRDIVRKAAARRAHVDALSERLGRQTELFSEHRQALISATVAGQVEVSVLA